MNYFADTAPWTLNSKQVEVVEDNEHLGLIVSGLDEELKNADANIHQCRKSLFALLGPAYAFKCLLPPSVQKHLWQTYNLPVLLSGLSAIPIRPANLSTLEVFHHKVLRSFLKLSSSSPIPALHFMLGELPLEARLHIEVLSLFYNIWCNPDTTIHKIVRYLLQMSSEKSLTWSAHVRNICIKYELPSPLALICSNPWNKNMWSNLVKTKITVYYENLLRNQALQNSKMRFLNVSVQGLSGVPHPALLNIQTTQEVRKLRAHVKFLCGDYLTAERLWKDQGLSPVCRLCSAPVESFEHILTQCRATIEIHSNMLPELLNTVLTVDPSCSLLFGPIDSHCLTQFILDCTSLNLPNRIRIAAHNPKVYAIFSVARNWCYGISRARARLLSQLKTN